MSGQEIAVRDYPAPTSLSNEQLQYIARTEFVPTGLRGNLPAILACVATGRALGLDDMTALRSIHVIEGKATFSAELMVQLVRRKGHSIQGEVSDGSATVTGKRADNGDTMSSTWTMAMANRAGLSGKGNWKKYPEAMLWARAVSQLCRMLFADCFAGATYTTEELGAESTDSYGAGAAVEVVQEATIVDDVPTLVEPDADARTSETVAVRPDPAVSPDTGYVGASGSPSADRSVLTGPQAKKLNVLVGKLRPDHITTDNLYRAVAAMRGATADEVAAQVDGVDDNGSHWAPLRDSLNRDEGHSLIDRLEAKLAEVESSEFRVPASVQAEIGGAA